MQKDMHYYVLKVLCQEVGFSPEDSQIIAYSSQYVDDNYHENKFRLRKAKKVKELKTQLFKDGVFTPVPTVHKDLQFLESLLSKEQKEVLVPFHFLPKQQPVINNDFVTKPNSELANLIVDEAINNYSNGQDYKEQKLIRLGIALHSYADTWSHQGFSGVSGDENKKRSVSIFNNTENKWEKAKFLGLFPIGHGTFVGTLPDRSFLKWRYRNHGSNDIYEINNPDIFMDCVINIFKKLASITGVSDNLDHDLKKKILHCIEFPYEGNHITKMNKFKNLFPNVDFKYNKKDWIKSARKLLVIETANRRRKEWIYEYNGDLKWYFFLIEVLNQRKRIS